KGDFTAVAGRLECPFVFAPLDPLFNGTGHKLLERQRRDEQIVRPRQRSTGRKSDGGKKGKNQEGSSSLLLFLSPSPMRFHRLHEPPKRPRPAASAQATAQTTPVTIEALRGLLSFLFK